MIVRRALAAAGLVLAVAAASAPGPAAAAPANAAAPCDGVTVIVDSGDLGGRDVVECAPAGGSAAELFAAVGVTVEFQPGMQDFVCTLDGEPADRDCTGADAYWSLWWSDGETDWAYATLGASSLDLDQGGYVAFVWHEGDGRAEAPAYELGGTGGTAAESPPPADEGGGASAAGTSGAPSGEGSSFPTWIAVGIAVLVIGAAGAVPILRRRAG